MRRLWLVFAQAVTIGVAILFVVQTLKPEWLAKRPAVVALQEAPAVADEQRRIVSYSDAARKALPSVVHIYTSKEVRVPRHPLFDDPVFRHFFGDRFGTETQRTAGLGSGVVVSDQGFILTNNHVIEGMDDIEVALNDGRKFKAKVAGADPDTDLAVLRINAGGKLPAIILSPPESVRVGDVVLAIGNPFGVGQTVTMGIVSALGRSHLGINTFENFIQTDAAINPGNSGGALVDTNGHLVGINTAIYSRTGGSLGIGFAIPISLARNVMEQIIQTGSVTRGWIGVEVQEITAELARSFNLPATEGALIAGVMRDSPADKAGIRPGDILVAVNGRQVADPQTMLESIAALTPGQAAKFRLLRAGKDYEVDVTIGRRPRIERKGDTP
jgi:Do/DeqQ family serine protease